MLQKSITIVNEVKRKKKKLPSNFWIIKIDVKAIIVRLQIARKDATKKLLLPSGLLI